MNMATKHEVLQANLTQWLACNKDKEKRGALIAKLSEMLALHPKSIGRSMKRIQMSTSVHTERRGRPTEYGPDVQAALSQVWEAMECPCAENMTRENIDEYLGYFIKEQSWNFNAEVADKLLAMSTGTKKLCIASMRTKRGMLRGRSATVASPLKGMIPIRKSHTWTNLPPGYLQADSVVHCGDRLTGDVVYSVGGVDFATYWSEYGAQWNKGREETLLTLKRLRPRFPFPIKELHPDTGNEFINYHVHQWTIDEKIDMTRSEPNKKNDNMCIEERNNNIPRRHLGYVRMDDESLVPLADEILRVACLLHNHFRPVRRMTGKTRVGSKWKRTFEKVAKTPYRRVLEREDISEAPKQRLLDEHDELNPLELKRKLDTMKAELGKKLDYLSKRKSADR